MAGIPLNTRQIHGSAIPCLTTVFFQPNCSILRVKTRVPFVRRMIGDENRPYSGATIIFHVLIRQGGSALSNCNGAVRPLIDHRTTRPSPVVMPLSPRDLCRGRQWSASTQTDRATGQGHFFNRTMRPRPPSSGPVDHGSQDFASAFAHRCWRRNPQEHPAHY